MANNEFSCIEAFVEGFTRTDNKNYNLYDGMIFGIEFLYKDKYYRITRDPIGNESELVKYFKYSGLPNIKLFMIPNEQYPDAGVNDLSLFLGIFENIDELLETTVLDNRKLKDILVSEETTILAID